MTRSTLTTLIATLLLLFPLAEARAQSTDHLDGHWRATVDGKKVSDQAVTETVTGVGLQFRFQGKTHVLTRKGDVLRYGPVKAVGIIGVMGGKKGTKGPDQTIELRIDGSGTQCQRDDTLSGTWLGKKATFERIGLCKCPPPKDFDLDSLDPVTKPKKPVLETLHYERGIEWGGDHPQLILKLKRQPDGSYLVDIGGEDWPATSGLSVSEAEIAEVRDEVWKMRTFPGGSFAGDGNHWYTVLKVTGVDPDKKAWSQDRWFYDMNAKKLRQRAAVLERAAEALLKKLTKKPAKKSAKKSAKKGQNK